MKMEHPLLLLEKGVLKVCSKFTGGHSCRIAISPVNLLHIFRKPIPRNISGWLFVNIHESNSGLFLRVECFFNAMKIS